MSYPSVTKLTADVIAAKGRLALGCFVQGGKIIPALSPVKVADINYFAPSCVKFCEGYGKFIAFAAGNIYSMDTDGNVEKSSITLPAKKPFFADTTGDSGIESFLIGDKNYVRIRSTGLTLKNLWNEVAGGAYKNGRLFAIDGKDGHKIQWSGTGGVDDWSYDISAAGWAYVKEDLGKIVDLAVYGGDLIALCEYGVCLFSAFGNTENFKRAYMGVNLQKIDENTAAVAAEKLVFCAGGRVHTFDKNEVKELAHEYADDFFAPLAAVALGDWYYVCGQSAGLGRGVILSVNASTGEAYYIDASASAMCSHGNIWGFTAQSAFKLGRGGYTFTSGNIDFGTPKRKLLKSVHLGNCGEVDVEVTSGVKTRILRGVKGYCRIDMSGKDFKICVQGNGEIGGIQAVAEAVDVL